MTTVYFVRHAHSPYTPDEYGRPLSDRGFIAAEKVRQVFSSYNIDVVLASPYRRAIQTVEGVAADRGLRVITCDGLKERRLASEPVEDFEAAIMQVWSDETFALPGGESNQVAQRRGIQAFHHILEQYRGKSIVIGTHGNIMTLIMQYFDSRFNFNFWKSLAMPDVYELTFEENNLLKAKRIWEEQNE